MRLFNASNPTHNISWGSGAGLDDLFASACSVFGVLRPTADVDNLGVAGKTATVIGDGFMLMLAQWLGGTVNRHPRLILGRALNDYTDIYGSPSEGANVVPINVHSLVGLTWSGSAATFYNAPIKTARAAANAVAGNVVRAGGGALGSDASSNLQGAANGGGGNVLTGDFGWLIVYRRQLTPAQIDDVQTGLLTCMAGDFTRGIAMLTAIADCELIGELAVDGTPTDRSGNGHTGTLTGSSAGTAVEHVYDVDQFSENFVPAMTVDETDQGNYRYASSYSESATFTTLATAATLFMHRSLEADARFDKMAKIGLFVDGAFEDHFVAPSQGLNVGTITGLGGSSKALRLRGTMRSRPNGSPYPTEVLAPVLLCLDAAATETAPVDATAPLVVISESLAEGGFSDAPSTNAVPSQLRDAPPAGYNGVAMFSYGGMNVAEIASTSTLRDEVAAALATKSPLGLAIMIGFNDKLDNVARATFESQYVALVNRLLTVVTTARKIALVSMPLSNSGTAEGANGNGDTADDFRTSIQAVVTTVANAKCVFVDGKPWLSTGQWDADNLHANNAGNSSIATGLRAAMALTPASVLQHHYRRRRAA